MGNENRNDDVKADRDSSKVTDDMHDNIVQKEMDAAMISLKKRIDNLKGVDVTLPKKPNPFRRNNNKS